MKQKIYLRVAIMIISMLCIGGCKSNDQTLSKRDERMQNQELIVALGSEPEGGFDTSISSHGTIMKVFFSTLFQRDQELGWEGDLAKDYEVSADKLVWTVTIRDDAYFTDGEKVTASDVVFTYKKAKESASTTDLTMVESVTAKDDYTVEFTLTRPYSTFLERLASLGIMPEHAYGDEFKQQPIGSGPYEFLQWDKGQQVIAKANEDYYGEQPKIKKLTIVFMDMDTAYEAVRNGEIDVAQINGMLANTKVEGTKIIALDSIECYGICFPMVPDDGKRAADGNLIGNNVTSDWAIRKALNVAVDREAIVNSILGGYGTVSTTGLEQMPWLNEDTVLAANEYGNVEQAKEILEKSGWCDTDGDGIVEKDGVVAEFTLLYTSGTYRQEFALEFVRVAKEIGIQVSLSLETWDTIIPKIHQEAVLYGFGSGDPSELYNLYYGECAGGAIAWDNSGCYQRNEVDECIDEALGAEDEASALRYWKELQTYTSAKGDVTYCWLVNVNHVFIAADEFNFGTPVVQPHGGRIFDNVAEWSWIS